MSLKLFDGGQGYPLALGIARGLRAALASPGHLEGARLRELLRPPPGSDDVGERDPVPPLARIVARRAIGGLGRLPGPWLSTCLYRSIAECLLLRAYGVPAYVCLGVRKESGKSKAAPSVIPNGDEDRVAAHAWVRVVGDHPPAESEGYTPLESSPGTWALPADGSLVVRAAAEFRHLVEPWVPLTSTSSGVGAASVEVAGDDRLPDAPEEPPTLEMESVRAWVSGDRARLLGRFAWGMIDLQSRRARLKVARGSPSRHGSSPVEKRRPRPFASWSAPRRCPPSGSRSGSIPSPTRGRCWTLSIPWRRIWWQNPRHSYGRRVHGGGRMMKEERGREAPDKSAVLRRLARERILVLDGAMGTMIQAERLREEDFRGDLLRDHPKELKGNNDLLCLSRPGVIAGIHDAYLAAGADIITTNTFNATAISQQDYGLEYLVRELNLAAARLAREAADRWNRRTPDRPRFVAGSIPPTSRTASISPDAERPGHRNVSFEDLVAAYTEQAGALLDGGVDILMIETVFDTLNAKAAIFAVLAELEARRARVPVWISGTITDKSGRTLSGQTTEAFWVSVRHAHPFAVGLNCALGTEELRPHLIDLARRADTLVAAHPNAGLPNEEGGYDESPERMAASLGELARAGLLNIVGGCCGTRPEHIAAIARAVDGVMPRLVPGPPRSAAFSGLEVLRIAESAGAASGPQGDGSLFVNVGERTNVAGSRGFSRMMREEKYEEALRLAGRQVRQGAQILDVNMDDPLLDPVLAMREFLLRLASDPEVARVPVMIDSSRWEVIEAGLRCLQGKCIVNSLSLGEGEEELRRRARLVRRYGAAAVVMCLDERGQADTLERRREICERAYRILVEEEGWDPADLILDANVFAVGTGMPEHDRYALDFIETVRWIKDNLPGALTSGGVSNLSFAYRGNDALREAMHAVFLHHAVAAGLDMAIVNAGRLPVHEDIEPRLREAVEDLILARRPDATERLGRLGSLARGGLAVGEEDKSWRALPVTERLRHALVRGIDDYVEEDTLQALEEQGSPLAVVEGPLMGGMNEVGALFGEGKMFLPQVIRAARVMKQAVRALEPALLALDGGSEEPEGTARGKILLATVRGDVHDIGKNILGVVLGCNGYRVIDLGVMVPVESIIEAAREEKADVIGVSGLITPSLDEMVRLASELQREGLSIPLLIGGATTSRAHTALRIDPVYEGPVVHVGDASLAPAVVAALLGPKSREAYVQETKSSNARLRERKEKERAARELIPLDQARSCALLTDWTRVKPPRPRIPGLTVLREVDLHLLRSHIDWTPFFRTFGLEGRHPGILDRPGVGPEARRLLNDAEELLTRMQEEKLLHARAVAGLFPAAGRGDDVVVFTGEDREEARVMLRFPRRQQPDHRSKACPCLADFLAPEESGVPDWIGAFALSTGFGAAELAAGYERSGDDYRAIMVRALADRLAEAFAEWLHGKVREELWGHDAGLGIRPAPGFPACPDHSEKAVLFDLLDAKSLLGIELTESFMMVPGASICGYYFSHPEARYFAVGRMGPDQVADYAARKDWSRAGAERWLGEHLAYDPGGGDRTGA